MKELMHRLFLSCLRATELIEKQLYFKLSKKEKLQLKMHKMMCDACSRYEKQNIFLEKGISLHQEHLFSVEDIEQLKLIISDKLADMK